MRSAGARLRAGALRELQGRFLRAVFALQRRRARRQGLQGGQVGTVSFIQLFGSALPVTPHFHSLVPDGVFVPREGGVRFEALPPPTQGEVEQLLRVVRHRVLRLLEKRGALPAQGSEDALQAYQAHSQQQRLRWSACRECTPRGNAASPPAWLTARAGPRQRPSSPPPLQAATSQQGSYPSYT
jgi:hypothetical protein